jgi:outer membrane immunogenic protein
MLKKIMTLTVLSSLLATPAFAALKLSGFYVGIGGGRETAVFDNKLTVDNPNSGANYYYKNDNSAGQGYSGTAFAGVGAVYENFYIGSEINASTSSLKYNGSYTNSSSGDSGASTLRLYESYGVSILPGIKLTNNALLYGRIGYVKGRFKYSESNTYSSGSSDNFSGSSWLDGMRYGVGIGTPLAQNVGMRLEYSHYQYRAFSSSADVSSGLTAKTRRFNVTPKDDQVSLDVVFAFS